MNTSTLRPLSAMRAKACLALAIACAACGDADPSPDALAVQLGDLENALVRPEPGISSSEFGSWKTRRQKLLEQAIQGPSALGRQALERLEGPALSSLDLNVVRGLLEVAARTLPAETTPRLVEIFETYGYPLPLRQTACSLLGEVAPEDALKRLKPLILEARPTRTLPAHEVMLEAYLTASAALDEDPVPVLADVATSLLHPDSARNMSVKALAQHPSGLGQSALEAVLVESTGNAYIRRLAAQALWQSTPESSCATFERVASLEADLKFLAFLANMIDSHCP